MKFIELSTKRLFSWIQVAKFDALVRSLKTSFSVIPAEAGIQEHQELLDPGFRRGDGLEDFSRGCQISSYAKPHAMSSAITKSSQLMTGKW